MRSPESGGGEALSIGQVLGEVVPAFERLRQAGKTRFLGLTAVGDTVGAASGDRRRAPSTAPRWSTICSIRQRPPRCLRTIRRRITDGLFDHTGAAGTGVIGIRVLAGGALSGSAERHPIASPAPAPIGSAMSYDADVARARRLMPLVDEGFAASLAEAATRFAISHPALGTILVGMATPREFEDALAAVLKGPLPPAALERLAALRQGFAGEAR